MNAEQLRWFKSSYSSGGGGECIEVAACPTIVHVRDSKNVQGSPRRRSGRLVRLRHARPPGLTRTGSQESASR
ncbi:DUF397 domain-containing protein [Streptomyces laculatispora]|uniref:DUF397 domain-containing protein n=1 Tax=Streptomyces laculatispora TaxID=887464 RepID=UPI0027DD5566|nr:DUF397 domain-containing protein [Streptomyces laculatispora]